MTRLRLLPTAVFVLVARSAAATGADGRYVRVATWPVRAERNRLIVDAGAGRAVFWPGTAAR